jgi:hypothetical protein
VAAEASSSVAGSEGREGAAATLETAGQMATALRYRASKKLVLHAAIERWTKSA